MWGMNDLISEIRITEEVFYEKNSGRVACARFYGWECDRGFAGRFSDESVWSPPVWKFQISNSVSRHRLESANQQQLEKLCTLSPYNDEVRFRIKRPFLDNLLACMKGEINCINEVGVKKIYQSISQMCKDELVQEILKSMPAISFSRSRRIIHFCIKNKMTLCVIGLIRIHQYLGR